MANKLTKYPSGLDINKVAILELQTTEPSSVLFSDGTAYATKVKAGGTRGAFWLESDGIHFNVAGVEKLVPTVGADEVPSLGNAYIAGQSITANAGAIAITDTSTGSTNTITIGKSGTNTGNAIGVDLDAAVGGRALYIDAGAGARTAALAKVKLDGTFGSASGGTLLDVDITQTGAAASSLIDVDVTAIYTGSILDVAIGAAATTGYVINADLNLGVAYGFMNIDCGAVTRTADVIDVTFDGAGNVSLMDINHSNTGSGNLFDIDISGTGSGNVLDIVYSAASTGDAVNLDMTSAVAGSALTIVGSGARTDDLIKIDDNSTGSAEIFDINISGVYTGSVFDIAISGAATTGAVMNVDMDAAVAYPFLALDAGNSIRTSDLIDVTFDGAGNVSFIDLDCTNTGSGDLIDIDVDGLHTGNEIDITYGTAASTGNAIDLNMGTNVAGSAIDIASAGTADGAVVNIAHTGNLANGATAVKIASTGDYAGADGNTVEITQATGAGTAGNYALYVSATGANVEGLHVDDGGVVLDETLSVGGATTMTGTLTVGVDDTGLDVKFYGATASAYMLWDESADDLILAGAAGLSVAGATSLATLAVSGITTTTGTQELTGAGAVDVTNPITELVTTAADALTLADGAEGQHKYIVMKTDGGDGTLTPAHFTGGSTITFDAVGDSVHLLFTAAAWYVVGENGIAIA
ncbi:hypothetical protein KAU11_07235 [Candidatus Babeliales bacterium]|nr:hypothetical protein [Candidatus Babeliales bacterium]